MALGSSAGSHSLEPSWQPAALVLVLRQHQPRTPGGPDGVSAPYKRQSRAEPNLSSINCFLEGGPRYGMVGRHRDKATPHPVTSEQPTWPVLVPAGSMYVLVFRVTWTREQSGLSTPSALLCEEQAAPRAGQAAGVGGKLIPRRAFPSSASLPLTKARPEA